MTEADRREFSRLYEQIGAAMKSDDPSRWDSAADAISPLLAAPGYATASGQAAVPGAKDGRVLRDWWERGGSTWIMRRFTASGDSLLLPPTMRPLAAIDDLPKVVVCDSPPCGRTAEFLRTVEDHDLRLQGYERAWTYSTEWSKTNAAGGRSNPLQRSCSTENRDSWAACVVGARSARFVFQVGDFRLPAQGWLFLSRGGMLASACPETTAVNLRTGETRWSSDCKHYSGQAGRSSFREVALLSVLAGSTSLVSEGQIVEVPAELRPAGRCSEDSAPPDAVIRGGNHQVLQYWLWDEGHVLASGSLRPGNYQDPVADVVDIELDRSRARLVPSRKVVLLPPVTREQDELLADLVAELAG